MIMSDNEWISRIRGLTDDQQSALINLIMAFSAPNQVSAATSTSSSWAQLRPLIGLFDEQSARDIKQAIEDLEQIDLDQWQ